MRTLLLTTLLMTMFCALAQEEEVHDPNEVFYKQSLTDADVFLFEYLANEQVVKGKVRGDSSRKVVRKGYNQEGKLVIKEVTRQDDEGNPERKVKIPHARLKYEVRKDTVYEYSYGGFLPIDTSKQLIIRTTRINDDGSYSFVRPDKGRVKKPFQKTDLYFRYEDDEHWAPMGAFGNNLEPLLAFDKEAYEVFKKYKRNAKWGTYAAISGAVLVFPLNFTVGTIPALSYLAVSGTGGFYLTTTSGHFILEAVEEHNIHRKY